MATITQDEYADAENIIKAFIEEQFPNVSTRKGSVFRELVVTPAAIGYAVINKEVVNLRNSQSLKSLLENPELVDDSVVDGIISNFFITRKEGTKSTGLLKITVSQSRTYVVEEASEFLTSNGLTYVTEITFQIDPNPASADVLQLFTDTESGTFFFLLPVTAESVGSEFSITQGTQLSTEILGASLILVEAFNDFSQGTDRETTEDLVTRTRDAISVRDLVTTKAIRTVIPEEFEFVEDIAVIGAGDEEMRRDRQPLVGFNIGGKVDIYTRTSSAPVVLSLEKTTDALGRFSLATPGVDIPFYFVQSIVLKSDPLTEATDFSQTITPLENTAAHLGNTASDRAINARFSVYETAEITIATEGFTSTDVIVQLVVPQNIQQIQVYVLDNDNRVVAADLLVKGMIPVFVELNIDFTRNVTGEAIDLNSIKQSLFDYINGLKVGEELNASKLVDIIHNFEIVRVKLPISMTGTIIRPDNSDEIITSNDVLEVPSRPEIIMSQNNTVYYITLDDITLTEESLT